MATVIACVIGGSPQRLSDVFSLGDVKARLNILTHTGTINGETSEDDDDLRDEDFVSLSPPLKGGQVETLTFAFVFDANQMRALS